MSHSVPILMYHSVDESCAPAYRRWAVSPATFEQHLAVIHDRGFEPLTVTDLARRREAGTLPDKAIAITFDDGLADFAQFALPLLERFGFASTLFVTTGYVGETARWLADLDEGDRPMLDWAGIAALTARNVEIGAHTHSHPQLDLLHLSDARREIEQSKTLLEAHIGREVTSFAYPHGYSTPQVRRVVAEAGFAAACRVADGLGGGGESSLALSRFIVTDEWTAGKIADLLDGSFAPRAPAPDGLAMQGWRLYRRLRLALSGPQTARFRSTGMREFPQ